MFAGRVVRRRNGFLAANAAFGAALRRHSVRSWAPQSHTVVMRCFETRETSPITARYPNERHATHLARGRRMKQLLGGCLQAVGVIIAGLSGVCTLMGLATINSLQSFGAFIRPLLFQCIPIAIGVGLFFAGRVWSATRAITAIEMDQ